MAQTDRERLAAHRADAAQGRADKLAADQAWRAGQDAAEEAEIAAAARKAFGPRDGEITQETEDAVVNHLLTRLMQLGHYETIMDDLSGPDRELVEAAMERYAAKMRAAGERGW